MKTARKLTLVTFITLVLIFSSNRITASNNIVLTTKKLSLLSDEQYDINIKNKIKGSQYKWSSTNTKVASVNPKNGVVTGKASGKTVIRCKITFPNGKSRVLKANVSVGSKPDFFTYDIMAHALGGVGGLKYLNSKEGLEVAYSNGFRFIEADLILTSDDKVVALHDWDKAPREHLGVEQDPDKPHMSYDEFMNLEIQDKLTPVDLGYIIEFMKKHKDVYFEFDVKARDEESARIITEQIVELANHNPKILDRILMQFISEEAYQAMNNVYNFKYYQYFAFKRHTRKIGDVIKFCKKNNITSVAVNYNNLTDTIINQLKENGILILTHTIDDIDLAEEFLEKGVDIICTNFITPVDLKTINK